MSKPRDAESPGRPRRRTRLDSRRDTVLGVAARLFVQRGFDGTSMRDIAAGSGMLSGSIYSHFSSKDELYLEVYRTGIQESIDRVQAYASRETDPWRRLVAASAAHLEMMFEGGCCAAVVMQLPKAGASTRGAVIAERDRYETAFTAFVDGLAFAPELDRRYLRLAILGAVNWAQTWYRSGGETPAAIAAQLLAPFRANLVGDVPEHAPVAVAPR